ncbi:MAG: 2-oxo acid dehydrogenase subunit E2 [Bacteroidales bacterium]|nr:2-oxo acid dehydrogenase subunit E2 [Bacteroidales bacterium]
MARFDILMPKMGESVIEATITKWLKKEGDRVEEDEALVEIATDKVDSEIPSPVEGILVKILYQEGETVAVGTPIAHIEMEGDGGEGESAKEFAAGEEAGQPAEAAASQEASTVLPEERKAAKSTPGRFYSPLVRNIARSEGVSQEELDRIGGSGKDGRVTKNDILAYLEERKKGKTSDAPVAEAPKAATVTGIEAPRVTVMPGDEVIEMDRMRRLIADHMVMSKHVSPHVTMFHEVDVTHIVGWRERIKEEFQRRESEKITFTPVFVEAAAKALRDFPLVNSSVDGYRIIRRKNVHIGMATALPNGNLIVPVIRNADQKNLLGLVRDVNDLARRARNNKLLPDEIMGGTFTITNFGQFGNLTGAPIINQPQVAILGIGTITKKPVVIESEHGDMIAIRHMMILSLAFDHRIVDGALGGMFLQRVANHLEQFDTSRSI